MWPGAASGVLAAAEQIKEAMASSLNTEGYFVEVIALIQSIPHANLYSVAIGVSAFLIVRLMKRYAPKVPGALVALVLLTTLVALLDLPAKGVAVLGNAIPSGLPALTLPTIPLADYLRLLPGALAIVAILLCEGLLVVRSYSNKYGYKADGDQMLFAYGAANLAAGFTGSLVTGNSPSRSAAMDASGARSQLPSLVAAGTIAIVHALLHRHAGVPAQLRRWRGSWPTRCCRSSRSTSSRELWRMRRSEFWIAAVCLLSVLALGPLRAVLIAFLLSTIDVIRRASSPETAALVEAPDGSHFVPFDAAQASGAPGLVVYRFGAPLYFANATRFLDDVERLVAQAPAPVRWFVLDAEAMVDVDTTGAGVLRQAIDAAGQEGHHLRRQPRRSALPLLAGAVRADGARRRRTGSTRPTGTRRRRSGRRRHEGDHRRAQEARDRPVRGRSRARRSRGLGARGSRGRRRLRDGRRDRRGQVRLGSSGRSRASCSATSPSAGCSTRARAAGSRRAISWSASSAAPTPFPAPTAPWASGTCAATASTPSAGSRRSTGSCRSAGASSPSTRSRWTPSLGILGVLLEPMTVITKALEQVVIVGRRSFWEAETVLVTGAGPIGLLAACGARLHGKEVHVLDRVETGLKPELVRALGATYHSGSVADVPFEPDAIIECTGVGSVIADAIQKIGAGGVVCLTGVGAGGLSGYAVPTSRPRWSSRTT